QGAALRSQQSHSSSLSSSSYLNSNTTSSSTPPTSSSLYSPAHLKSIRNVMPRNAAPPQPHRSRDSEDILSEDLGFSQSDLDAEARDDAEEVDPFFDIEGSSVQPVSGNRATQHDEDKAAGSSHGEKGAASSSALLSPRKQMRRQVAE